MAKSKKHFANAVQVLLLGIVLCLGAVVQAQPTAWTLADGPISLTNAVLRGMVNPRGLTTRAWFEWGTNSAYQQRSSNFVLSGSSLRFIAFNVNGIASGVLYQGRVVASNQLGVVQGRSSSFGVAKKVWSWGDNQQGQLEVPSGLGQVVAVAAGEQHSLALRADGTVHLWGANATNFNKVPVNLSKVMAIAAAGQSMNLALQTNGRVVAWGQNDFGQTNVPSLLTNAVAVAAGTYHGLALKRDGRVAAWGRNDFAQAQVASDLSNVVAVAAGHLHSIALKDDGRVVGWGDNMLGQIGIPPDLTNAVAIAATGNRSLAMLQDGTVLEWGNGESAHTAVGAGNNRQISAGTNYNVAVIGTDGVFGWGLGASWQVPTGLSNVLSSVAGANHALALAMNTSPSASTLQFMARQGRPLEVQLTGIDPEGDALTFRITQRPSKGMLYQSINGNRGAAIQTNNCIVSNVLGRVIYVPETNFYGTDQFSFVANDGHYDSAVAVATMEVVQNLIPEVLGQSVNTAENQPVLIQLTGGDVDGDTLTFRIVELPSAGKLSQWTNGTFGAAITNLNAEVSDSLGRVWFMPEKNGYGSPYAHFVFAANDGVNDSAPASVFVNIENNQTPHVEPQTLVTPENTSFVVSLQGSDPENDALSFRITQVPSAGTLFQYTNGVAGSAITTNNTPVQDPAGQVLFMPGDRQWGDPYTSFNYVANDGTQDSPLATVTVIVPRNYEPVVESFTFTIPQNTNLVITLAGTDAENEPLVFRIRTLPGSGTLFQYTNGEPGVAITTTNTVVTDAAHRVVFIPTALQSGTPYASFTYTASDPLRYSVPGEVVINVFSSNRAPTAIEQMVGMPWNSQAVITLAGTDADSDPLSFRITGTPDAGSLYQFAAGSLGALIAGTNTLVSDVLGRVIFVPASNQTGDLYASFSFVADDGQARSGAAPVSIRVARPAFAATHAPWILRTNTTLRGMVSANGTAATWWFEWGSNLALKTTPVTLAATNGVRAVAASVSALSTGVSYGCRLVVSNAAGVVYGNMELFGIGSKVWGWGRNDFTNLPASLTNVVAVEAGYNHAVALRNDGRVVAWGANNKNQTNVPAGLSNVVAISAKADHTVALRADGTIASWGDDSFGQLNLPSGLTNVVQISAGYSHSMVLVANGKVVSWGYPFVPVVTNVPPPVTNIVAISAGSAWSVALRNDGIPFAWGNDNFGDTMMPAGLSNVWLVSAGDAHGLAYRRNGTGVGWGWNYYGQASFPGGLTNAVKVLAGDFQSLALRENGSVTGWGYAPLAGVPAGVSNVVALAAGVNFNLAVSTTNAVVPGEKGPPIPDVPTILSVRTNPQGRFEMDFTGSQGVAYQVWGTTNLVNWTQVETPEEISPGTFRFIEPPVSQSAWRIFRVRSP